MQVTNNTPLPAAFVPSSEENDEISALVLASVTYRIPEGGGLLLSAEQRPLRLTPTDTYPTDAHLNKTCVSVTASGHVYPAEDGDRQATARLLVGAVAHTVVAFGPRVWQEGLVPGTLSPTTPLPFEAVPMTWDNAYGGSVYEPTSVIKFEGEDAIVPEHDAAFPLNISGTGFYMSAQSALLNPLPQLEHPEYLIRSWDDRPEPVCFAPYPLYGGMRAASIVREKKVDLSMLGRLPSRAAPRGTFTEIPAGTAVKVEGMRPRRGSLAFEIPPSPVFVEMWVGEGMERVELRLDAVDIDADGAEVRLVYRSAVRYGLVQYELRKTRVEMSDAFLASLGQAGSHASAKPKG